MAFRRRACLPPHHGYAHLSLESVRYIDCLLCHITRTLKQGASCLADEPGPGSESRDGLSEGRPGLCISKTPAKPWRSREQSGSLLPAVAKARSVGAVSPMLRQERKIIFARSPPRPSLRDFHIQRPRTGCLATEQARCDVQGSAAGRHCAASDHVSRIRALAANRHNPGR